MLCLWPDQCHPGPAGPPNPLAYLTRLPLPFYGNPPESSRPGRASISVRLGGLVLVGTVQEIFIQLFFCY